jgi:hypothetical protein
MDNLNLRAVFNERVGIVIAHDNANDTERCGARLSKCRRVGDLHASDVSAPAYGRGRMSGFNAGIATGIPPIAV